MRDKKNQSREQRAASNQPPNRLDQAGPHARDQAYRRPETRQNPENHAAGSDSERSEPKRLDQALRDQRRPQLPPQSSRAADERPGQQTQWSQLETEERRRREAIRRAQSGRMTYPEQREQREQRIQTQDDQHFDGYVDEDFEEESPRKKGSCLGYLIWFLVFIALGYFSLWFLIHGVSWLL